MNTEHIKAVIKREDLRVFEKMFLVSLISVADENDTIALTKSQMCGLLDLSQSTVDKSLRIFREKGILVREKDMVGRTKRVSVYRIVL